MDDEKPLTQKTDWLLLIALIIAVILWFLLVPAYGAGACSGYIWQNEYCIPHYLTLETWFEPAPAYSKGNLVFYSPGMMEATAEYHDLSLEGYLDGVALMSPADIGKEVWIKVGKEWKGPYLSVDCANIRDMYGVIASRGEVIEVGFQTALDLGMVYDYDYHFGTYKTREAVKKDVEIWIGDLPETVHRYKSVNYRDWWLSLPKKQPNNFRNVYYREPGVFVFSSGEKYPVKDNPYPPYKFPFKLLHWSSKILDLK